MAQAINAPEAAKISNNKLKGKKKKKGKKKAKKPKKPKKNKSY